MSRRAIAAVAVLVVATIPVGCSGQGGEADDLVEVAVQSEPEGARVYFVPTLDFSPDLAADSSWLAEYEIAQGRAPAKTVQYEQAYVVLFVRGGDTVVKKNVRVVAGQPNVVAATFDTASSAPEQDP